MMHEKFEITTDAAGAGTVVSARPMSGLIYSVRYPGTVFAGTADYTVTRRGPSGGTILNVSDAAGPWQYSPREQISNTSGGTVASGGSALVDYIPTDDYVQVKVAQGGSVLTDSLYVYWRRV